MLNRKRAEIPVLLILFLTFLVLHGCQHVSADTYDTLKELSEWDVPEVSELDPDSEGDDPYVLVNNNEPFFELPELSESGEFYSELDELGRCGCCVANIGEDLMPTEERGSIGAVKPTGWQTVKYDFIDGKYLYNRCHLIGYQLTAENDNEKNLITGTRYLNIEAMLPFENIAAEYIKRTGNHVLYRVTPVYEGDNLVATGVLIEAESVEDNGESMLINIFCRNIQPGVIIDYSDGSNREDPDWENSESEAEGDVQEESTVSSEVSSESAFVPSDDTDYILNKNSMKFHYPNCEAVQKMSAKNRAEYSGSRDELIEEGYKPCGMCNP